MRNQSLTWLTANSLQSKEPKTSLETFGAIAQNIQANPPRVADVSRFENSLDAFSHLVTKGNPHYELR